MAKIDKLWKVAKSMKRDASVELESGCGSGMGLFQNKSCRTLRLFKLHVCIILVKNGIKICPWLQYSLPYCTCDSFNIFYLFIYLFLILFMAVLGLRFCARAFSSCGKRGPLFIAVRGSLTIAASLVAEHRLQTRAGSVIVAHGPSCSAACGIFPDQGSTPCALHWQADSQPLCHQGSPSFNINKNFHLSKCLS